MTKPETSALFRSMIAIIVAQVFATRGDLDFGAAIQESAYLPSLSFGFIVSYSAWVLIGRISRYFNLKYDWVDRPVERFVLQGITSGVTPVLLMVTLNGFVASVLHGTNVLTADLLIHQLTTAGTFVLFVNLLYFVRYLRRRMQETQRILRRDFPYYSNLRF